MPQITRCRGPFSAEWPSLLNVAECLLQITQFPIYNTLGLLGTFDGLCLKRLDCFQLSADIVCLWLESLERLFYLVDDGCVLEHASVVGEVDFLRLLAQQLDFTARVIVTLLEGGEGGGGLSFEAQLRAELRPVEFECCAAL